MLDESLGAHCGKRGIETHDQCGIDSDRLKGIQAQIQGLQQRGSFGRPQHTHGMWKKREYGSNAMRGTRLGQYVTQDFLMAEMHAVKIADGDGAVRSAEALRPLFGGMNSRERH